jgi:uncharacterized protein YfaS (alpha-2-macroglobulin family)
VKRILTLLFIFTTNLLMAQDLDSIWKEIDKAYRQGNLKSMQPQVEEAISLARQQKKVTYLAKGLFYDGIIKTTTSGETDDVNPVFENFRQEIGSLDAVNQSIFQLYYGKLYQIYFEENRWRIVQRTEVENQATEDVRFWTESTFRKRINEVYTEVLSQKEILLNQKSSDWKTLFLTNPEDSKSIELTPSLFDSFTHYYVEFLKQKNEPVDKYLEQLAEINLKKGEFNAYLYNQSLLLADDPEKLQQLAEKYPKAWYSGELYKTIARKYYEKGDWVSFRKVFEIEQKVRNLFPDSEALKSVSSLVKVIQSAAFSIEMEKYIPENTNTAFKISHKNLNKVYVRILDYNVGLNDVSFRDASKELNYQYIDSEARYYAFLKKHKTVQEYSIDLKVFDDYQQHSSLFNLKPLQKGRYIVLFSEEPEFKFVAQNPIKCTELYVSNTAVEYDNAFRVTDRNTGKPLAKKSIQVYKHSYNNSTQKESYALAKTLTTDDKGEVKFTDEKQFVYRLANEQVFYGQNLYHYDNYREPTERENISTKIFTDRAIYRPGQTIYFKGIVTRTKNKSVSVISKEKTKVYLRDTNHKILSELDFITNEFGSFHGEFVIPTSVLTGSFQIEASTNGWHSIQVEEYKRPKFRVEIDKPQLTYQLGDTVKITGKAEAFSGANIDGAQVEFRVYRQAIYPFRYWGRIRPPFEPEEQVAFGSTETDKDGRFSLDFAAIPARKQKDSTDIRTYVYRVEASVTDLNGETQVGNSSVKVGDKKILLSAKVESKSDVKLLENLKISATNLNDQPIDVQGTIQINQLQSPNRIFRKAQYTTDYQYYSKAEFINLFPNEPYGEEANPENWEKGKTVFAVQFDTRHSTDVKIPGTEKFEEGYYLITLKSAEGTENTQLIYLTNERKKSEPQGLFTYTLDKKSYEPGEVAKLSLNTSADNLYVYLKVEADGKLIRDEVIRLIGKSQVIEIPIKENYRGGIWAHYKFVKFNIPEQGSIQLEVPFDHKKLNVTTSVTRDKLTPGATEKWQFTVSGKDKDKLLAEVLTGMYDASLDQFASNSFEYFAYNFYNGARHGFAYQNYAFIKANPSEINYRNLYPDFGRNYSYLPFYTYEFAFGGGDRMVRQMRSADNMVMQKSVAVEEVMMALSEPPSAPREGDLNEVAQEKFIEPEQKKDSTLSQIRKALQETAFFYPNLKTDKDGNVSFEFTVPESLTEWKLMAFAHTPDMKTGYYESRVKTQKDLMVVPNVPRFLREGDELRISTKIVNLSEQTLNGTARLSLTDAISGAELDKLFGNTAADQSFKTAKGESGEVSWTIKVPKNIQAITYKIAAAAGNFSDGEESVLPVVTNRILVTENLPISIRENQSKTYTFDKLVNPKSNTLDNFNLTFEMTTNPLWFAIFSLPYLREYPYECSEQVFSRLYGNLISENIISSQPKIKAVFDDWNRKGELKSKLELNLELKNILLEETPWVRDAVSEEEQMKRISVLFDLNKMQQEMKAAFDKLSQKQQSSGGFAWFDGGRENEYITTHIVSGFGNLKNMKIDFKKHEIDVNGLVQNAVKYIDQKQLQYYSEQKQLKKNDFDWNTGIHYLYARSFFLQEYPMPKTLDSLKLIYLNNIKKSSKNFSLQTQAMSALVLNRFGEKSEAEKVLRSVNERSVDSDEMGKYWKSNLTGWYWYQTPVETQALLIEAFDEVLKDEVSVEAMKVWLLKNRQTNQWNSTKATTKAVYALMNTAKSWIDAEKGVSVKIGGQNIDLSIPSAQAGSGYVKMAWNASEIKPEMGKVEVKKTSPGVAWGAMYWQYFEELDKITPAETGIAFKKKLYLKENSASGQVLREITAETPIQVGALVTVRLEISIDRNMEFVHIKDMRASGFEPVNVLSGYRWKDGFGYYESTRDLATNFFADYMRKGTYVFEYDLRANNAGNFSNGITQMQNMYAPELSAHSEGIRVEIR